MNHQDKQRAGGMQLAPAPTAITPLARMSLARLDAVVPTGAKRPDGTELDATECSWSGSQENRQADVASSSTRRGRIGGGRLRGWGSRSGAGASVGHGVGRSTVRGLAVGCAAIVVSACGSAGGGAGSATPDGNQTDSAEIAGSAAATPVTLVLDWSPNTNHAGIYLAQANGWYDEAGVDLTIIEPGASGGLQAVATGSAQFAISVQEELTPARASGVPVVSVAAIVEHNTSSLLTLASDGITRPADLAGTRYGGWGGQLEHAIIDALVTCDGGNPSEVDYVSVGDADYRVGLEQDQYDSVWIFDGWDGIRFSEAGIATSTIKFGDYIDCIPDWYTPLIATSEQLIADDPDLVSRFIETTARGYQAAMVDPDSAAEALLTAAPELDAELVRASSNYLADRFASDPQRWGYQDPKVWTEFTEFLDGAEMLSGPVDIDAAYSNEFLALNE